MRTIWEILKFCWPIIEIVLVTAGIIILPILITGIVIGFFNDKIGPRIGLCANWWWHENGIWFILLISTLFALLTATVKTFIEPSPLNWEVRQEMSDKNSKLNKSASYLWAYLKGSKVEKKENIFLDIEPMKTVRPSGPGWFIKFWILFGITFIFSFKAWTDEILNAWKEWRKRSKENQEARSKKEKEPHEKAGFINFFFPAFLADITTNLLENWKK